MYFIPAQTVPYKLGPLILKLYKVDQDRSHWSFKIFQQCHEFKNTFTNPIIGIFLREEIYLGN